MPAPIKPRRTPSLRLHKLSQRGFVELEDRRIYLGAWGDPKTQTNYHRLIAEWTSAGYRLPVSKDEVCVVEVVSAYLDEYRVQYQDKNGDPSSTYAALRTALDDLLKLYGNIPAIDFGPKALRAVRQIWVDRGLAISTINAYAGHIKRTFKWAASNEMVSVTVYQSLCTLSGLRRGRGVGKDPAIRMPAPLEDVEKTLLHLSSPIKAAIRLMLYTGARPTEVLKLKRGDIDDNGDVWTAVIREHKTNYRGKQRRLFFGPRAQAVLRPFLLRPDDKYLFSPREAQRERDLERRTGPGRRPNQKPNIKKTDREIGECYEHAGLNRAIARVCEQHGIPKWTPYQLRHLAATTIEATADLETASAILGHSGLNITQVYVHRDNKTAAAWAATHG